jgi:hypothetical protein
MKGKQNRDARSAAMAATQTKADEDDQEPTGYNEQDEDDLVVVSRFSFRDDESMKWLELLTSEAPDLSSLLDFSTSSRNQTVSLTPEAFERRLIWCLGRLGLSRVPADLISKLYQHAIFDRQQMSAFNTYQDTLRSELFTETHGFIQYELKRLEQFAKLFGRTPKTAVPARLVEWNAIWLGSLVELARTIASQLLAGEKNMVEQQSWLHSGRSLMESHLLSVTYKRIKSLRTEARVSIGSFQLLVAYAHASSLVLYPASASDGEAIHAMKMRLSRSRASKTHNAMLSLMIRQGIQQDRSK